jgi:hypothetical protein
MICIEYRRWIAALGCCIENCAWAFRRCQACHTGPHALSRRSSDLNCIPLCAHHHREFDSNPKVFVEKHKLDIPTLIEAYNLIGLRGVRLHRPARQITSPEFVRTACICGWRSGWFRVLADAQGSLHAHLGDSQTEAA